MTTPREIIMAAYAVSTKNRPEQFTAKSDELFDVLMRAMRGLYLFAANINPEYFGDSAAVNFNAGAPGYWSRPGTAVSVWRIENAGKDEVIVVPRAQLKADVGRPALWRNGQKYFSAGNPLDPTNGTLTFFFSARAAKPATLDTAFDASWPTDFDPLLIEESAMYLALQDGRTDEAATLQPSRDKWATQFANYLEIEQVNVVYQYGNSRNFNVPSLIKTILAGGTAT